MKHYIRITQLVFALSFVSVTAMLGDNWVHYFLIVTMMVSSILMGDWLGFKRGFKKGGEHFLNEYSQTIEAAKQQMESARELIKKIKKFIEE